MESFGGGSLRRKYCAWQALQTISKGDDTSEPLCSRSIVAERQRQHFVETKAAGGGCLGYGIDAGS